MKLKDAVELRAPRGQVMAIVAGKGYSPRKQQLRGMEPAT